MDAHAHDWQHEPLEETLSGARRLTVSVVDELVRDGWEQLAQVAGVPRGRWRRHHPVGDGPLIELVDGEPAFDAAAWVRVASLVPGAVALRTRTAAMLGVAPADLRPPGGRPLRLFDLHRARRLRRTLRQVRRAADAELGRLAWALDARLAPVLAPGDDGTRFEQLPAYALAARFELAVDAGRDWRAPVSIDLANGAAIAHLLRLLGDRGRTPGAALLELARLTRSDAAAIPHHLQVLHGLAQQPDDEREERLEDWLEGLDGWHAMRDLLLEAPPLRDDPEAVRAIASHPPASRESRHDEAALDDPELEDAVRAARELIQLREQAAHLRADLHAALRAVAWTLARRLEADGTLDRADLAFDLHWRDLLRVARGVATSVAPVLPHGAVGGSDDEDAATFTPELRGIPASAGTATGRVVVLDEPTLDAPVDGAVLVCRVTDPAWLPLMLRAAALVTERGGPLSHAAIVARELGLPAIVGVAGARAAARAAETAHVDGAAGLVRFA